MNSVQHFNFEKTFQSFLTFNFPTIPILSLNFQPRFPTSFKHQYISTGYPDQNINVPVNSNIEQLKKSFSLKN